MAAPNIVAVKQLAHRLESSSSSERIDALSELQSLARTSPDIVGEIALRKTFELLKEQSSPEEYCEALDLTLRLIKCRNKDAATANAGQILSEIANVELLLDLLEHSDLTVGVMTSQILTELHSIDGHTLEQQIQHCPDGMMKLLQRLPDSSREEVRNQAIVLIQQLTTTNEELKKTVVFNEGFEILFKIILEEGGFGDAGIVVNDCLKICQNILSDSEICQRLFYAMRNEWIIRLAEFFNPTILEKMNQTRRSALVDDNENEDHQQFWFQDSGHLSCAISAISVLYVSLITTAVIAQSNADGNPDPSTAQPTTVVSAKHQNMILDSASIVLNYAAHWIARCGPIEILNPAFSLILAIIHQNIKAAHFISQLNLKIFPNVIGKNIPFTVTEIGTLEYGWKPLMNDESKYISFLSLLAERYIFPTKPWLSNQSSLDAVATTQNPQQDESLLLDLPLFQLLSQSSSTSSSSSASNDVMNSKISFEKACLLLFEKIISVDQAICDLIIQSILAPPPQLLDDDEHMENQPLEFMKPLGFILVSTILDNCEKLFHSNNPQFFTTQSKNNSGSPIEMVERCIHVLTNVYLYGSQLSHELTTAITTNHIKSLKDKKHLLSSHSHHEENKLLLPYMLASVGRAARLPGGIGYHYIISILQLLSIIASDCERATHQMFEDPSNLFVVDLATASSELAGVPSAVQAMACLFLGCCFCGFPNEKAPDSSNNNSQSNPNQAESLFNRRAFISMIENRITINRFLETLKKPIQHFQRNQHHHRPGSTSMISAQGNTGNNSATTNYYDHFFFLPGFKQFYEKQIETIRSIILELFYGASSSSNMPVDAFTQQLIQMQQEKIKELELQLQGKGLLPAAPVPAALPAATPSPASVVSREEDLKQIHQLQEKIEILEKEKSSLVEKNSVLTQEKNEEKKELETYLQQIDQLKHQIHFLQQHPPHPAAPSQHQEQLEKELNELKQQLSQQQVHIDDLQQQVTGLENKNFSLMKNLETKELIEKSLKIDLDELHEEMESLKRINSELEMTNFTMKNSLLEKENESSQFSRLYHSNSSEVTLLQQKLSLLETSLQELTKEKEMIHSQLQKKDLEILSLKEKFNEECKEKNAVSLQQQENLRKIELYEKEIIELKRNNNNNNSNNNNSSPSVPSSPTRDNNNNNNAPVKLELEKYKINYQILLEAYLKLSSEFNSSQSFFYQNYLDKIIDPLMNTIILLNLQDEQKDIPPPKVINEDDNDGWGDDNFLEDDGLNGEKNEKTQQEEDLQLLKQFQLKIQEQMNNHSTTSAGVLLPASSTHPTHPEGIPLPPAFNASLHAQFYDLTSTILSNNIQILEDVAARCSDYTEGILSSSLKYSLQGSEGSLLRIVDCCKQLNILNFNMLEKYENYEKLLENYEFLQSEYHSLQEKYAALDDINQSYLEKDVEKDDQIASLQFQYHQLTEQSSLQTKQLELNAKEQEIALKTTIDSLEKQIETKQQEILQLQEFLKLNQNAEKNSFQQQIQQYQQQILEQQKQFDILQQEKQSFQEENSKQLTEIYQLTSQLQSAKEELHQIHSQLNSSKQEIVGIYSELQLSKDENNRIDLEFKASKDEIIRITNNAHFLEEQIISKETEIHSLEKEIASLKDNLQKQSNEFNEKSSSLIKQVEELKKSQLVSANNQFIEKECEEWKGKYHEKLEKYEKLEKLLHSKEKEFSHAIETLQMLNKQNNEDINQLNSENEQLRSELSSKDSLLRNEYNELQETIENLEIEKENYLKTIQEMTSEKQEIIKKHFQQMENIKLENSKMNERMDHKEKKEINKIKDILLSFHSQLMKSLEDKVFHPIFSGSSSLSLSSMEQQIADIIEGEGEGDDITFPTLPTSDKNNHNHNNDNDNEIFMIPEKKWNSLVSFLFRSFHILLEKISFQKDEIAQKTKEIHSFLLMIDEKEQFALQCQSKMDHYQQLASQTATIQQELSHCKEILLAKNQEIHEKNDLLELKDQEIKQLESSHYLNQSLNISNNEIKRLSTAHEKLSKDYQQKEQELKELKSFVSSKTGELEGLKITLKDYKNDIHLYQQEIAENNLIIEKLRKELKHIQHDQDMTRLGVHKNTNNSNNLSSYLHSSQGQGPIAESKSSSSAANEEEKEKYHRLLLKIQSRLEKFSQLSQQNNNNNNGAQMADGPVPAKIFFKNLQQQSSLSLDKLDTVLDELFQQYQKEISSLRTNAAAATALATQSASPSTSNNTNTKTPSKASHASQESSKAQLFATPHQNKSAGSGDSPLIVPGSAISSIAPTTTKKQPGERWNEASMVMKNVSPATKEAAKLNSELLKERKKFYQLQEQHTELLSLLAQQEVEINVFKHAVEEKLGEDSLTTIEEEAQQNVVRLYGSYVNYRNVANDF